MCPSCLLLADQSFAAAAVPTSFLPPSAGLVMQQEQASALFCQVSGLSVAPHCWSSLCPMAEGTAGSGGSEHALLSLQVLKPSMALVTLPLHKGHSMGFRHKISVSGGGSNGWKQISCRKSNPTARGCQVWEQSHWSEHTPRVCHPASPSSACMAATISGGMAERRRKRIPFLYSDTLFLHELGKLVSRKQKEVS